MVDMDLIVLGTLMGMPMHGYQLKQMMEASFGKRYFKISNSALYPRLARLEAEGYIEGHREAQEKIPDRKVYNITEAGRRRVRDLAATPLGPRENFLDFQARAVFFGLLAPEERRRLVEPLMEETRTELEEANHKLERFGRYMDRYSLIVLESGIEDISRKIVLFKKLMDEE